MKCVKLARIRKLKGGWKLADADDTSKYVQRLNVALSIQGSSKDGYHLIMQPEGLFAADTHHDTLAEAKEVAADVFGATDADWVV